MTVRHRARYVNEKCVGCGECAAVCPVTYPDEYDFGVSERTAISRPFANAVPATFAVDRKGWSPCKTACPVHTSAQGYVALVAQGRFEEAYKVAGERNPFPSVCGRICTHLCETECTRGEVDEPVAVAALKRFVADTVGPLQAISAGAGGLRRPRRRDRRRAGRHDLRPRPRRHGVRRGRVRGAAGGGRHAAPRHPGLPAAARRPHAGDRPDPRQGSRAQAGAARRDRLHRGPAVRAGLPCRLPRDGPAGERERERCPATTSPE